MPQEGPQEVPLKIFLLASRGVSNWVRHVHQRSQQAGREAVAPLHVTARRLGLSHWCVTVPQARPQHVVGKIPVQNVFPLKRLASLDFYKYFHDWSVKQKIQEKIFFFGKRILSIAWREYFKKPAVFATDTLYFWHQKEQNNLTSLPKLVGKRKGDK